MGWQWLRPGAMMRDAHTHNLQARDAVIAVEPLQFSPKPGLHYAVGIHPWQSQYATPSRIERLELVARHPQVVAIGETGLDSLRGASLEVQEQLMTKHVQLAHELSKPLVVHMVRTSGQVLKVWKRSARGVNVMIHGMRANERVARPLIEAGFYLSFGQNFNPHTLHATPLDRVLIETDDAPFLTIEQVVSRVALELGMSAASLLEMTTANLQAFLGS